MTKQIFGEVSWDSGGGSKNQNNSKDSFLKLVNGDNIVRIITRPQQYILHKVKFGATDKYGQKIGCSKVHGSCPICDLSDKLLAMKDEEDIKRGKEIKAKPRWYVGVISRTDGRTKILDISWTVFDQIKKLATSQHWGNPAGFDINILVDTKGGATGYYSTQPLSKTPLTAQEQLLVDSFQIEDLQRRVTPPQLDAVMKRIEFLERQYQFKLFDNEESTKESLVSSDDNDSDSDSDENSDFPSFND